MVFRFAVEFVREPVPLGICWVGPDNHGAAAFCSDDCDWWLLMLKGAPECICLDLLQLLLDQRDR